MAAESERKRHDGRVRDNKPLPSWTLSSGGRVEVAALHMEEVASSGRFPPCPWRSGGLEVWKVPRPPLPLGRTLYGGFQWGRAQGSIADRREPKAAFFETAALESSARIRLLVRLPRDRSRGSETGLISGLRCR